MHETNKLSVQK